MDTYHEMDEPGAILQHVMKALKPGGRLVIAEAVADERRDWSRSKQEDKHELHIKYAKADLEKAGFEILRAQDPFLDRTAVKGDKMWVLVARKPY